MTIALGLQTLREPSEGGGAGVLEGRAGASGAKTETGAAGMSRASGELPIWNEREKGNC